MVDLFCGEFLPCRGYLFIYRIVTSEVLTGVLGGATSFTFGSSMRTSASVIDLAAAAS